MRLDPFLSKKSPDPDEVVKSAPAEKGVIDNFVGSVARPLRTPEAKPSTVIPTVGGKQSLKSETFSPVGKQAPPGPRIIEIDGDQDGIARIAESDDPAASFRPGYTTDKAPEGDCLMRPVGKVWSDEARAAALEARRLRMKPKVEPPVGAPGGVRGAQAEGKPREGRAHLTALQENAENARREGNKDGAALLMVGARAIAGQAVDPKTAARAHALLEEHESDAEKDGNQELLSAVQAARGALSRYMKKSGEV